MSEAFAPWDAVDYINTFEDVILYLEAAIDEDPGDGTLIQAALGDIVRAQNMSELARNTGLDRSNLYKAMAPEGNPSFATILKVIKGLGLRLRIHAIEANARLPFPDGWPTQMEESSKFDYAVRSVPVEA